MFRPIPERLCRIFFNIILAGVVVACVSSPERSPPAHLSMVQGGTTDSVAQFNVLVPKFSKYQYRLEGEAGGTPRRQQIVLGETFWRVDRLRFEGLTPRKTYTLLVTKSRGVVVDRRRFRTLESQRAGGKVVMASCMADVPEFLSLQRRMWRQVAQQQPDVMIFNGDLVYTDTWDFTQRGVVPSVRAVWQRYIDTFQNLEVYRQRELKPVLATWDDHDFGYNNADQSLAIRQTTLQAFKAFFGFEDVARDYVNGPGVSTVWTAFGQKFILLDDRSWRQVSGDRGLYAHLGQTQEDWVINQVKSSTGPVWLVNGGQFFGGYLRKESFESDHPVNFKNFLRRLKRTQRKVLFLSGDIHLSELMSIESEILGFPTYEITSSPIHSFLKGTRLQENPNPRRLVGVEKQNFIVIEWGAHDSSSFKVRSIGERGEVYFRRDLPW